MLDWHSCYGSHSVSSISLCTENAPAMNIQVTFVEADGRENRLPLSTGRTLMRGAVSSGVESVAADCGGTLTCATCHVYVDPPWAALLPAMAADEDEMLHMTASPREPSSRLSCQISLTAELDGMRVRLPPTQY
jgi:ferredoxin, 2Fe-2S